MARRHADDGGSSAWSLMAPSPTQEVLGALARGRNSVQKVLQSNINPHTVDTKELGKMINRAGPNYRDKALEFIGAQIQDEFPEASIDDLIKALASESKITPPNYKIYGAFPEKVLESLGSYNPNTNKMKLTPSIEQTPESIKGVIVHEMQHAKDFQGKPFDFFDAMAAKERIPEGLSNRKILNEAGINSSDLRKLEKIRPGTFDRDVLSSWSKLSEGQQKNILANFYRTAKGNVNSNNTGFIGTDPYAAAALESIGHFKGPFTQEADIALQRISRNAALQGKKIHPEYLNRFSDDLGNAYEGNASWLKLKGSDFKDLMEHIPDRVAETYNNLAKGIAATATLTGAGVALKKEQERLDKISELEAKAKEATDRIKAEKGYYGPAF